MAFSLPRARGEVVGRFGIHLKQHAFLPVGGTHRCVVPGARRHSASGGPNGSVVATGRDLVRYTLGAGLPPTDSSGNAEHFREPRSERRFLGSARRFI